MKRVIFLGLVFLVSMQTRLWAQGSSDFEPPTLTRSLEVSLSGLRKSTEDVTSRNAWLREQIGSYQMHVEPMQAQMEYYQTFEAQGVLPEIQETAVEENYSAQESLEGLTQDKQSLERKIEANQSTKQEAEGKIQSLSEEIGMLRKKVNSYEDQEIKDPAIDQHQSVMQNLDEVKRRVSAYEEKLAEMNKAYGKPFNEFLGLKERNSILKQQVFLLEQAYQARTAEEENLRKELEGFQSSFNEDQKKLEEDISLLQSQEETFENSLTRAERKLKKSDLALNNTPQEHVSNLSQNLAVITGENASLKDKLTVLQTQWTSLDAQNGN